MSLRLRLSTFVIAAALAGCGSRAKPAAAPAGSSEPDYDWTQFKGGAASAPAETAAKSEPKPADDAPKVDAPEKKSASATKIAGQSVSEVSADDVATASKRATKRNVVSTNVIVGAEYEQLNIVLDKMAVQIIRPAATPDKSGPKVRSPKARNDDVAETDAAFYDATADVLVLVRADKKATSKRALAALVGGGPKKKNVRPAKPKRTS